MITDWPAATPRLMAVDMALGPVSRANHGALPQPHFRLWVVPSGVFDTQREAEQRAKEIVGNLGGGEVRIQGREGRWRDSDTVPPGSDPHPPTDTKH